MTKQQYLEAVVEWKAEHVQRIDAIRKAKIAVKDAQRSGNGIWGAYSNLNVSREAITRHLIIRSNMKEQAHRDYLASRAVKEAA